MTLTVESLSIHQCYMLRYLKRGFEFVLLSIMLVRCGCPLQEWEALLDAHLVDCNTTTNRYNLSRAGLRLLKEAKKTRYF